MAGAAPVARGVNKVILIGHLGQNPDARFLPNGDAVTSASIATTEKWKDKQSGEEKEATEWHRLIFYRRLGEIAGQYLSKGSHVYVEGKLRTRKYTTKEGQERQTTEIIVNDLQMLGGGKQQGDATEQEPTKEPARESSSKADYAKGSRGSIHGYEDDDIPFN